MIFDLMLPGMDGLDVYRTLKAGNDPVLILMPTAKDEDIDKIIVSQPKGSGGVVFWGDPTPKNHTPRTFLPRELSSYK